jgi:hypothetical protein
MDFRRYFDVIEPRLAVYCDAPWLWIAPDVAGTALNLPRLWVATGHQQVAIALHEADARAIIEWRCTPTPAGPTIPDGDILLAREQAIQGHGRHHLMRTKPRGDLRVCDLAVATVLHHLRAAGSLEKVAWPAVQAVTGHSVGRRTLDSVMPLVGSHMLENAAGADTVHVALAAAAGLAHTLDAQDPAIARCRQAIAGQAFTAGIVQASLYTDQGHGDAANPFNAFLELSRPAIRSAPDRAHTRRRPIPPHRGLP